MKNLALYESLLPKQENGEANTEEPPTANKETPPNRASTIDISSMMSTLKCCSLHFKDFFLI